MDEEYVKGEVLVRFNANTTPSEVEKIIKELRLSVKNKISLKRPLYLIIVPIGTELE